MRRASRRTTVPTGRGGLRDTRGFLLVTVVITSLVLVVLVLGAAFVARLDRQAAVEQRRGTGAYYVAKAGMAHLESAMLHALHDAFVASGGAGGSGPGTAGDPCGVGIEDGLDFGDGVRLSPSDAATRHEATFELEGGGTYDLSYGVEGPLLLLRSVGSDGVARATVDVVATVGEGAASVWDNALVAGTLTPGAAGGLAGTIGVYGSIHIIAGDATVDTDVDLTGNAGVFNTYAGKGDPQTDVQSDANAVFADDALRYQDLCTRVKMASGDLEVGALNSAAGTRVGAAGTTEGVPNAIEGIYLDLEAGDHAVRSKGEAIDPVAEPYVFVRNPVLDYEAFAYTSLPSLEDAGHPPTEAAGVPVRRVTAATCPWIGTQGGVTALRLPPDDPSAACADEAGDPVFAWDAANDVLEVVPAGPTPVAFPGAGLDVTGDVAYRGETTWFFGADGAGGDPAFTADAVLGAALRPADGDYLTGSALGIVTNGDVTVDAGPNDVVAAMLYAADTVDVAKQTTIFGTVVGETVVMQQVPRIATNRALPGVAATLGMPGANEVQAPGTFRVLSEERR
ncbi:MAG: hypothetical protein RI554_06820 [Trueperaceae bacterium]|nr:hypothetical protein [Trueperaceae bacterium]